jgi:Homeodomain-like domain
MPTFFSKRMRLERAGVMRRLPQRSLCPPRTVAGMRERCVEQGWEAALHRKKQGHPSRPPLFDGEAEAHLIALRCAEPPQGHARWTLRLLAETVVELEVVAATSHETVRRTLNKTR